MLLSDLRIAVQPSIDNTEAVAAPRSVPTKASVFTVPFA